MKLQSYKLKGREVKDMLGKIVKDCTNLNSIISDNKRSEHSKTLAEGALSAYTGVLEHLYLMLPLPKGENRIRTDVKGNVNYENTPL